MNGHNKSSKPRFIFEEHNQFIKREPSIDEELHVLKMNGHNKSSKPRLIFEEHNQFIKREPSIDEELHTYPIIIAVKSEQNEETQNNNNDSQFPIEANAVEIQAKVLQTFTPETAKVAKHYTIATNDNDGNFLVPDLIENEFPIETKAVKLEVENFEPITENINIDTIKNENEMKQCDVPLTIDNNLRCNYCDFESKDLQKLLRHTNECSHKISITTETVYKVRDVKKGYIACDDCQHQTKKKSHLIRHMNERHLPSMSVKIKRPLRKLKHQCWFCDAKFTSKLKMKAHIKEHTMKMLGCNDHHLKCIHTRFQMCNSEKNLLHCNLCSHKCYSVSSLTIHARHRHGIEKIEFICDTCGLSFQSKSRIIKHFKDTGFCELGPTTEFTDSDSDNFDFDMYLAKNKRKYSKHQMQARGYRCMECSFKCTKPITLKEHKKLKHMNNKLQHKKTATKYPCPICTFESLSEKSLNEHMMKKHNGKKPYFCMLCDCEFSLMNDLIKHIKSHLLKRR